MNGNLGQLPSKPAIDAAARLPQSGHPKSE
jgi:hypothetical protein